MSPIPQLPLHALDLPNFHEFVEKFFFYNEFVFFDECSTNACQRTIRQGFLPFYMWNQYCPKLHETRCIMDPALSKIDKSTKKHARKYTLSLCSDMDAICKNALPACHPQNWLTGKLRESLMGMKYGLNTPTNDFRKPKFVTFEVRNRETGALAAFDVGYFVGGLYCSMSGGTFESGAGSVLLAALSRVFVKFGVSIWDFGMSMKYKEDLGAKGIPRKEFVKRFMDTRDLLLSAPVSLNGGEICCQALIKADELVVVHDTPRALKINAPFKKGSRGEDSDDEGSEWMSEED